MAWARLIGIGGGDGLQIVHGGVLVEGIVVRLPSVQTHHEVQIMSVGERVAVVQFAIHHIHVTRTCVATRHQSRVICRPNGSIVVGRGAPVLVAALHHHARQREVVLLRDVEGDACTTEEVVAHVGALRLIPLVLVCLQIFLFALGASFIFAMAETNVQISVDDGRVVVDVETCVGTALRVGTCLQRTVVARLEVFLQHDVDNSSRTFSREFRRRIVNHLYALDALRRQLLQNLRPVISSQSTRLSVDPHLHTRVATQRYVAIVVNLHAGYVLQSLRCRCARVGHQLCHIERLAVHLQLHAGPLSCNRHLLQLVSVLSHVESREVV